MQHKTVLGTLFFAACMTFALGPIANAQGEFKKRIKGTFENNIYTSPEKDFRFMLPDSLSKNGCQMKLQDVLLGELWCLLAILPASTIRCFRIQLRKI